MPLTITNYESMRENLDKAYLTVDDIKDNSISTLQYADMYVETLKSMDKLASEQTPSREDRLRFLYLSRNRFLLESIGINEGLLNPLCKHPYFTDNKEDPCPMCTG
jgi:hypothetical protein